MLKINFNTPFPHSQRDKFIHGFRELGFSYRRIIQNGDYSLFCFFGSIPCDELHKKSNVDVIVGSDIDIDTFQSLLVGNVEIYVYFERS